MSMRIVYVCLSLLVLQAFPWLPPVAQADCADPAAEDALATQTIASSALSPSAPHPILGRTLVAAGNRIYLQDLSTLAPIGSELVLTGTVESAPNPVQLEDSSYGAFVAQQDGIVSRINPEGATPVLAWQADLRRATCPNDSLSAVPAVHLRRYASASFQARYATDVLYVATRYDADCQSGNLQNRVYALDPETGAQLWVFNEDGTQGMDSSYGAPYLEYSQDRLVLATDRSASATQPSVWSLDIITGTKAWSSSVGQIHTSPLVRGNKIYVATVYGEIKALSLSDGATLWSVSNGGIPITTNVFREFRTPWAELIVAVDYNGDVWLVRDDGDTAGTVWTRSLVDPVTDQAAQAISQVAVDPGHGKLYVGADDGQIYQLNLVDGSVDATRSVSPGSMVGGISFVFENNDVNMIAGSSDGVLAKFCGPWSSEVAAAQATCSTSADCTDPLASSCSTWDCLAGLCVQSPVTDGIACNDGNNATTSDVCNAGTCLGASDCQQEPGVCTCTEDDATSQTRGLQTSQPSCASPPAGSELDAALWCAQEVTAAISQSACLAHGSQARTAVWIHLFDQDRRPFAIDPGLGSVQMQVTGGSGTPPRFLSPSTMLPLAQTSVSLADGYLVSSPNRPGTYYAYLAAQGDSALPSASTPWSINVTVELNNGGSCIDTVADAQVLSVPITMGHVDTQPCSLNADADESGFLAVRAHENGVDLANAPVQVGFASTLLFAQSFEESILNTPTGSSQGVTNSSGSISFQDYGSYLNGPIQVSATCPGGTIGDANTQSIEATTSQVELSLSSCIPPGYVTYQQGGSIYRIEASEGASAENISTRLDAITAGVGDGAPAVSRNGSWMTLTTERFHPSCNGWACLAIVNADFTAVETPIINGAPLHPEGRTAISDDGNALVFFGDGPHAQDLYLTQKSGGVWSTPLLLTSNSPHSFNNLPVLSPDGLTALFDCGPDQYGLAGTGVCRVDLDGSNFQQVIDPDDNPLGGGTGFAAHHGDFAPDGSVVFEADWNAEQLWRVSSPAVPTQIISAHSNDNSPCVLPNGNVVSLWLGRAGNPDGGHELKLTAADGSFSVLTPGIDIADVGMSCHQ